MVITRSRGRSASAVPFGLKKNTMNHSLKITLACTLLGVGFLIGTPRTHAALLAYDDFAYSAGNVNGDNGGTGWSSAWVSSASSVYASVVTGTALAYTGGSISVSGSGTALSIIGGGDGALNRSFVGTGAGSEVFFSFLFQSVVGSGDEFFHFYLSNDADRFNSGGIGDFNSGAADSRFGARINDGTTDTTVSSSISYVTGSTYFLVGRLSTDGSGGAAGEIDRVELWVNPTSLSLGTASATADDAMGLTIADLDVFSSRMVNFAGTDQVLIDELRIGTDIASVVPEPSAGMLVLLGGLFLLARRRKAGGRKA